MHSDKAVQYSTRRNMSIDMIKIIAMLGVIMLHTTHDLMSTNGLDIASFMYKSAVISIPLFFMVSGYLLLGRPNIDYRYSIKKIYGILRYMTFFCVFYWIVYSIFKHGFSLERFWQIFGGSFNAQGPFYVFWYFGAMIIIYLLLPLLNTCYLRYRHGFMLLTIFMLTLQSIVFSLNLTIGGELLPPSLKLYIWLTYFLLGGMIKYKSFTFGNAIIVTIMCIINYGYQVWLIPEIKTDYCSFFYSSVPILVFVVSVFTFIISIRFSNDNKLIKMLSKLFLVVFTIHPFFIDKISFYLGDIQHVGPILVWLTVSAISIFLSWLLFKIPYANKIFRI